MSGPDHVELHRRIGVAWRELRRGASASRLRTYLYEEGGEALDLGQVDTLDLLAQAGSIRMSGLAEALRVEASSATRAVDRLVAAGLAERRRSPADARVVEATLTDAGRRRHEAVVARRREAMSRILAGFAPSEQEQLADLLERLVAGVDTFLGDTGTRAGPTG
jgi:DNA-binding MarR family transcriptional regulator